MVIRTPYSGQQFGYCRQCDGEIIISFNPNNPTYEGFCDSECKERYEYFQMEPLAR